MSPVSTAYRENRLRDILGGVDNPFRTAAVRILLNTDPFRWTPRHEIFAGPDLNHSQKRAWRDLRDQGYIKTKRGPDGGARLTRDGQRLYEDLLPPPRLRQQAFVERAAKLVTDLAALRRGARSKGVDLLVEGMKDCWHLPEPRRSPHFRACLQIIQEYRETRP